MSEDYKAKIDALIAGEIETITINPDEFMAFQLVWQKEKLRKAIVGNAQREGQIIYKYVSLKN
ncbi:hypothetical protein ACVQ8P_07605 [Dellaglioa sp. BT-FLS60]|uniref:Uncharacterized protein n=3 Tax=Dellaglioa TaxID=2767880 RepID=A0A0R1HTQ6_9LACO|nr:MULTISPECIES: hypothetical protein [Dellaglioa]KRK46087.1 hypothetical protein FC66_GL000588 [Dellaglioa algida DSM 15638]MCZ2490547.1 hypothetical protein [Dellaglioa carnosa]MCZ2492176.1 hypothetical protein [Dellaglioa carnosa]MCZ2493625.1 hypothetical protein [Dellaglioa carnosa]MDK1716982.1 hypothetical protein [Dellaglioa algida]